MVNTFLSQPSSFNPRNFYPWEIQYIHQKTWTLTFIAALVAPVVNNPNTMEIPLSNTKDWATASPTTLEKAYLGKAQKADPWSPRAGDRGWFSELGTTKFWGFMSPSLEKAMAPHSSTLAWEIHGRRSLLGCSPWGREESDATERLHFRFSLSCIGEGNGKPLQCSCLENPRLRGVWWAAVYGVAESDMTEAT